MIISVTSEGCLLAGELLRLELFTLQLVSLRLSLGLASRIPQSHTRSSIITRVVNLINFPNVKKHTRKTTWILTDQPIALVHAKLTNCVQLVDKEDNPPSKSQPI